MRSSCSLFFLFIFGDLFAKSISTDNFVTAFGSAMLEAKIPQIEVETTPIGQPCLTKCQVASFVLPFLKLLQVVKRFQFDTKYELIIKTTKIEVKKSCFISVQCISKRKFEDR